MTGRQAEAFRRLGHFKSTVVRVLKRIYPERFDQAERHVRGRMGDLDDDVVLAYLEQFITAPPAGVSVLRDALASHGFTLPASDDLRLWAEHVRHVAPAPASPATTSAAAAATGDDQYGTLLGLFDTEPDVVAGPEESGPADPVGPEPAVVPLDELFANERTGGPDGTPLPEPPDVPLPEEPDDGPPVPEGEQVPAPLPPADAPAAADPDPVAADAKPDGGGPPAADDLPYDSDPAPTKKLGPSLRPEMLDTRRKKGKRKPRTTATVADPNIPATASDDGTLDEDTRNALLSSVALPRPVFASDLVSVVGDRELVSSWEREMRSMGMDAPVRFIAAKDRHRSRGSLVLPYAFLRDAASEFRRSWWAGCMDHYTGRRLYEVAVVLHQVGDQVVAHDLDDDVATFRLNQRRGVTGLVVVTGTDLGDGGHTTGRMADAVEELLGERLAVVAVLATHGETLEQIESDLRDAAEERRWDPPMPVVSSLAWEWADSGGATARPVLTGGR